MKKIFATIVLAFTLLPVFAQESKGPFRAYLFNKEYNVYLRINLYDEDITVPGQDLYGKLPGYLAKQHNSFCWLITSSEVEGNKATLQMINDYDSEDLTATLTAESDSIFVLKQIEGSTLKVPNNGKWQKLPKTLELKRR
ncbi:MAG: hypothetical protein IKM78_05360 [Prevotella sp.]|nr:hypothetical protein [Prevotella sp.]